MTFRVEIFDDSIWCWYRDYSDKVDVEEIVRKLRERGYEARITEIIVTEDSKHCSKNK